MATPAGEIPGFIRHNPLVPAAAVFLAGIIIGRYCGVPVHFSLLLAVLFVLAWFITELLPALFTRGVIAQTFLALGIGFSGIATWQLNQEYFPREHIIRFTPESGEVPVTARLRVLVPPEEEPSRHGDLYWLARVTEILTDRGWMPAPGGGDVMVRWRADEAGEGDKIEKVLRRNELVEAYGWALRPAPAQNPGAFDSRAMLAADRVFVEIRVPRSGGILPLDSSAVAGSPMLTRMRLFLRAKFLEHTLREDAPAALTLEALLLGHRDPAIADVSRAFTNAGIAHLLAISGSHIVFFTALVWGILRMIPMPPRWREFIIALVVMLYVLATPCGPPIVRAAVALLIVVLSRFIGRPRQMMNMLAAAAIVVVILRPADIADAGFQLSFVTTAGLILFAERTYQALFGRWLDRRRLIAELQDTTMSRLRLHALQGLCGLIVANLIGALTAVPLVAWHFGQINFMAPVSGLIALPVVTLAMVGSAAQLVAELCSSWLGGVLSPLTTMMGRFMVWVVEALASVPGASVALRTPPAWSIGAAYGVMLLWALRRRLHLSRAAILNAGIAVCVASVGWYAMTAPVGKLRMEVLRTGQGSCTLLQMPDGALWQIDAGSRDAPSLMRTAMEPAIRMEGKSRLKGFIITVLNEQHASSAMDAVEMFHPGRVLISRPAWQSRGLTLAGAQLERAVPSSTLGLVESGQEIDAGGGARIEILWPPKDADPSLRTDLIPLCRFGNHQVLLLDPALAGPLALIELSRPDLRCDVVILTGPERGTADEPLRRLLASLQPQWVLWNGRGPWAPKGDRPHELNTADGAVSLEIDKDGEIAMSRR